MKSQAIKATTRFAVSGVKRRQKQDDGQNSKQQRMRDQGERENKSTRVSVKNRTMKTASGRLSLPEEDGALLSEETVNRTGWTESTLTHRKLQTPLLRHRIVLEYNNLKVNNQNHLRLNLYKDSSDSHSEL